MRFAFVEVEKVAQPVQVLCRVLGVSRSGYYASLRRPECQHARHDRRLRVLCREAHEKSHKTYGSIRIHRALKNQGLAVSRKRVVRLMKVEGIAGKRRRRWTRTTDSSGGAPVALNLLNREFSPDGPNKSWAGDVTFLRTPAGFVYLAVVLDLFSRYVVGWAVSALNDRHLVVAALQGALKRRCPRRGLLHHSDQGSTGEFNLSSQHAHKRGRDGYSKTKTLRASWARSNTITWTPDGGPTRTPTAVLGSDCSRACKRRRCIGGGSVPTGWDAVVSREWRNAAELLGLRFGALPVVLRARRDRDFARSALRRAGDC